MALPGKSQLYPPFPTASILTSLCVDGPSLAVFSENPVHVINCMLYTSNLMSPRLSDTKGLEPSFYSPHCTSKPFLLPVLWNAPTLYLGVIQDSHMIPTPLIPFPLIKSARDEAVLGLRGWWWPLIAKTLSKIYTPSWPDPAYLLSLISGPLSVLPNILAFSSYLAIRNFIYKAVRGSGFSHCLIELKNRRLEKLWFSFVCFGASIF